MSDRTRAFREIYDTHHAAVCAYFARRTAYDDVEDLAAETFMVAWRKMPKRLEEPLPWLYAVARRVLANHRRKTARRSGPLPPPGPAAPDPADLAGDRGLAAAFAALSERDREAIRLVAWEDLSIKDAARAAGCSASAFAVRLSRARARLDRALNDSPERALETI